MFKRWLKRSVKILTRILILFLLASCLLVFAIKFINPPISAMMIYKYIGNGQKSIQKEWVSLEDVSPNYPLAIIAAEDQRFLEHYGFDVKAIQQAIEHNKKSKSTWGASTISQQLAKNLFLVPNRSIIRKGLEAYFTVLLELFLSKERIMELYLNIVETGDSLYGVSIASEIYFNKKANSVEQREAALVAASLPNPVKYNVGQPSTYLSNRSIWIQGQMKNLGGTGFLSEWYEAKN